MKTQIQIAFIAERLLFAVAKPFIFIRELAYSKIPKHLLPMAKAKVFARHIDFIYRNYKTSIPSDRKVKAIGYDSNDFIFNKTRVILDNGEVVILEG